MAFRTVSIKDGKLPKAAHEAKRAEALRANLHRRRTVKDMQKQQRPAGESHDPDAST